MVEAAWACGFHALDVDGFSGEKIRRIECPRIGIKDSRHWLLI